MEISEIAYELYKQDWMREHTTPRMRRQAVRAYENYARGCKAEGVAVGSYEAFLEKYGFNGARFVSYDEFCDVEYHDVDYIKNLLDDSRLVEKYLEDVDLSQEEFTGFAIVADVLASAEARANVARVCKSDIELAF